MILYMMCLSLFCIGLYGVLRKRNLVKIIISLFIMSYSTNLFFVLLGYRFRGRSPIGAADQAIIANIVDPIPQALALTSIVLGLATIALIISISIKTMDYKTSTFYTGRKVKGNRRSFWIRIPSQKMPALL